MTADRCVSGRDAYQRVRAAGVGRAILGAPPGFRPMHLAAAVAAGKLEIAQRQGKRIPPGWAGNGDGTDSDDPLALRTGSQQVCEHVLAETLDRTRVWLETVVRIAPGDRADALERASVPQLEQVVVSLRELAAPAP